MRFDVHRRTPIQGVRSYHEDVSMDKPDDEHSTRDKIVTRWNLQPLRTLKGDVYPTPPTESQQPEESNDRPPRKTRRRRPKRPSKS
jgi:hypothetical protein